MKTKSIILSALFAVFTLSLFAQLKVDQYGRIGMGTNWPNPSYKCHVAGNLLCTSYPANPYYELRLKVGNGWPGCEIGASSDILAFWTSEAGYNSLRASDFLIMSDSTMKRNGNELKAGMYIYTLVVNQSEVDSKKMILLN